MTGHLLAAQTLVEPLKRRQPLRREWRVQEGLHPVGCKEYITADVGIGDAPTAHEIWRKDGRIDFSVSGAVLIGKPLRIIVPIFRDLVVEVSPLDIAVTTKSCGKSPVSQSPCRATRLTTSDSQSPIVISALDIVTVAIAGAGRGL